MFKSDLNPYISQIGEHKGIILSVSNNVFTAPLNFANPDSPIIVDIGCGAGNFLRDYALLAPHNNFVGFELRYKRLVKGAIKFKKHNLTNIRLIQARAEDIGLWFQPDSIEEIHVNFPDPWPKNKHRKHRLITPKYLENIASLLKQNGCFIFKTDHEDYFFPVLEMIKQQSFFQIVEYSEDLYKSSCHQRNIPTEFELLFKNKGYPVYYIRTVV